MKSECCEQREQRRCYADEGCTVTHLRSTYVIVLGIMSCFTRYNGKQAADGLVWRIGVITGPPIHIV